MVLVGVYSEWGTFNAEWKELLPVPFLSVLLFDSKIKVINNPTLSRMKNISQLMLASKTTELLLDSTTPFMLSLIIQN